MKVEIKRDEDGPFYLCGMCLADHDAFAAAERCCSGLVEPDFDRSDERLIFKKPLTEKQIADQSKSIVTRESLLRRKSY